MGLEFELAARAAEFYAEQHKRNKKALNALPGAIAKEWEKRKPGVFKEASGGKTEMSIWIAHPRVTHGKIHTTEDIADALPEELAEMYKDGLLTLEKSASCSRSWQLCFNTFDLTNELTKEYIARDEKPAWDYSMTDDTPLAKRVKRHEGDEGDF